MDLPQTLNLADDSDEKNLCVTISYASYAPLFTPVANAMMFGHQCPKEGVQRASQVSVQNYIQ